MVGAIFWVFRYVLIGCVVLGFLSALEPVTKYDHPVSICVAVVAFWPFWVALLICTIVYAITKKATYKTIEKRKKEMEEDERVDKR